MAKATKKPGIRVNALAQELEVESKDILAKLRTEGLDWAPNHMSTITIGQAETVREWVRAGEIERSSGGGVATEVAPGDEHEGHKAKSSRSRKKKTDDESAHETPAPTQEAPASVAEAPAPAVAEPEVAPAVTPVAEVPHEVAKETHKEVAHAPVAAPATPTAPAAHAPAAPKAPPGAPAAGHAAHGHEPRPNRPTITLASRSAAPPTPPERKPVVVAPQLTTLAKPTMQGPKVIRVEKADIVAPLRNRPRPGGPGAANDAPAFTQARPATGRGVKPTDDDEESDKKKAAKGANRTLSARRRGPDGRRGEAMEKLKEYTEADLIELRDRINAASASRASFDSHLKKSSERGTHVQARSTVDRGEPVLIEEPITVKSLSAALGIKSNDIIKKLMASGVFANINQGLDVETATTIALDYGIELQIAQETTMEEELVAEFATREVDPALLVSRPPVVTILGHVDHGKTSLLDKIRNANVAAGEAGGITQHTAAWMVSVGEGDAKKRVTFIDTPGHQAFTSMRARGANMTDVVVLVVSAAEGVQPQTIESINHARAAGVPIVVAMNKIDRPDANDQKVLGELAANGLNATEWGGDTEVIRTSATTGQGIKELIEILDYQSQLLELKANPSGTARGTVIESRVDEGMGSVATVLVQDGTLKVGDVILAGPSYGRVRSIRDDLGRPITEAGPSMPVIVSGLADLPGSGEKFYVVDDVDRAKEIAEDRAVRARMASLAGQNRVTSENLLATMQAADVQTINLIIKADTQGSLDTLIATVGGQNTEEVKVRVIHSGVGVISESDVTLAMATKMKANDNRIAIIGFHVIAEDAARQLAEQNHIDVKVYRVIYEIFDDLKKALSGMLTPEEREKLHGHAEIRQVYKFSKVGSIAGCFVTDGHIQRGSKIRLIRDGKIITEDLSIETLKRVKDDVKEVKNGMECGIKLAGYDDIKQGDRLEAYIKETFQRTL